jgi:hypothetical protein
MTLRKQSKPKIDELNAMNNVKTEETIKKEERNKKAEETVKAASPREKQQKSPAKLAINLKVRE